MLGVLSCALCWRLRTFCHHRPSSSACPAACDASPPKKLFDKLQFDGMDSPASRKKYAISVRTSDFCWKTRLGGARQLGFCRARAAVYPAKRESRTEMAHFFQRAALARNGKAGRCASPPLCVLRVGPKLQQIEEFFLATQYDPNVSPIHCIPTRSNLSNGQKECIGVNKRIPE